MMTEDDEIEALADALSAAAKAATPGAWCAVGGMVEAEDDRLADVCDCRVPEHDKDSKQAVADARYIALCQPENIRALCDRLRFLEDALEEGMGQVEAVTTSPSPEVLANATRWLHDVSHADALPVALAPMSRDQAGSLLEEALARIKSPTANGAGYPLQVGGIYWRLMKVQRGLVEPLLDRAEGAVHATFLRKAHGTPCRERRFWPIVEH